jgi:hypothetical protein
MRNVTYLTHYYHLDNEPFRSLSALPDEEALRLMTELADDTPFGERFRDPAGYLSARKATEQWVRDAFAAKGGEPIDPYPIPMVLGSSKWMEKAAPDPDNHGEIRIPLSVFTEKDVSFTYPDSMISHWFSLEKPPEYYIPGLHGVVFTMPEILQLVEEKGLPEENWDTNLQPHLAPYIEAQVWNHALLIETRSGG